MACVRMNVDVVVDLDNISTDGLLKELESRGYQCTQIGSQPESDALNFDHVHHLAVCGQLDAARQERLTIVGEAIYQRLM